mgnify:CR=1 FL=1
MKTAPTIRRILPLFLLLLVACSGAAARTNVQLPAIRSSWGNLREAVVRQLVVEPDAATEAAMVGADQALQVGDPVQVLAVDWKRLDRAIELDLARQLSVGEIGTLGAESRRGLLAEFHDAIRLYTRTTQ